MSNEPPGPSANDSASIREWLHDLTYGEVHLFTLGFYSGLTAVRPTRRAVPEGPGLPDNNKWYHRGGYILGYILKILVIAGMGIDNADAILGGI